MRDVKENTSPAEEEAAEPAPTTEELLAAILEELKAKK